MPFHPLDRNFQDTLLKTAAPCSLKHSAAFGHSQERCHAEPFGFAQGKLREASARTGPAPEKSRFFAEFTLSKAEGLRMTGSQNLAKKTRIHDVALQNFAFETLRFSLRIFDGISFLLRRREGISMFPSLFG
ncbi:MAG: hypothetical protein ACRD18_10285 [Terriglobia bacterium]